MHRASDRLVPVAAALASFALVISFFAPRFVLWQGVDLAESGGNDADFGRAIEALRQLDDPSVRITNPIHRVINWRLLFPVLGHFLHLPAWAYLALPHLGCLLVLGYVAHLILRETGDRWSASLVPALAGTASWFFVSTGWLAYFDSWYLLGLLVVAFARSRTALATACLLTPWVDERFVVSLPLALVVRGVWSGEAGRADRARLLAEGRLCLAIAALYCALRLIALAVAQDEGSAEHLRRHLAFQHDPWQLLDGWWEGLRGLWVFVVAAVGFPLRGRHPVRGWLVAVTVVATMSVNVLLAGDLSRSTSVLVPAAVLGMLLLRRVRPVGARWLFAAVLLFNLLTPARHVIAGLNIRGSISPLHVEVDRYLHPPPDLAELCRSRGAALWKRGRLAKALRAFDEAIRLEPSSAEAHLGRADCLVALGRPGEAAASFDAAVCVAPERPIAYVRRARFRRARGDLPAAAEDLRKALDLSPPSASERPDIERALAEIRRPSGEPQPPGRVAGGHGSSSPVP